MKTFVVKLVKESAISFVVTFGGVFLATSDSLSTSVIAAAAVAGLRAVVGVIVKDVGDPKNTPSL